MEGNTVGKYYDAEGELYAAYLHEQLQSRRWSWRGRQMLLTAEPESLSEAAALVEVIYEYSLTHRINPEKAVLRISDIFDDCRRRTANYDELVEMSNAYYNTHAAYWRDKVRRSFGRRWLIGLGVGVLLAVIEGVVVRTRMLTRPYTISIVALLVLFSLLVVLPLMFAWLSSPKVSADERIYTWRMQ